MKLSEEEIEQLKDAISLVNRKTWKKLLDFPKESFERNVLKCNEEQKDQLQLRLARLRGAEMFASELEKQLETFRVN